MGAGGIHSEALGAERGTRTVEVESAVLLARADLSFLREHALWERGGGAAGREGALDIRGADFACRCSRVADGGTHCGVAVELLETLFVREAGLVVGLLGDTGSVVAVVGLGALEGVVTRGDGSRELAGVGDAPLTRGRAHADGLEVVGGGGSRAVGS